MLLANQANLVTQAFYPAPWPKTDGEEWNLHGVDDGRGIFGSPATADCECKKHSAVAMPGLFGDFW
jgi:hypothetical protein